MTNVILTKAHDVLKAALAKSDEQVPALIVALNEAAAHAKAAADALAGGAEVDEVSLDVDLADKLIMGANWHCCVNKAVVTKTVDMTPGQAALYVAEQVEAAAKAASPLDVLKRLAPLETAIAKALQFENTETVKVPLFFEQTTALSEESSTVIASLPPAGQQSTAGNFATNPDEIAKALDKAAVAKSNTASKEPAWPSDLTSPAFMGKDFRPRR